MLFQVLCFLISFKSKCQQSYDEVQTSPRHTDVQSDVKPHEAYNVFACQELVDLSAFRTCSAIGVSSNFNTEKKCFNGVELKGIRKMLLVLLCYMLARVV